MKRSVYLSSRMETDGSLFERQKFAWLVELLAANNIRCTQHPDEFGASDTFILPVFRSYIDRFIDSDNELEQAILQKKRILLVVSDEAFLIPPFTIPLKKIPFIWFMDRLSSISRLDRRKRCQSLLGRLKESDIEYCAVGLFSLSEDCTKVRINRSIDNGDPWWASLLDMFLSQNRVIYSLLSLSYPEEWHADPECEDDDDLANLCRFLQASSTEAAPELPAAEPAEEKAAEKPEPSPAAVSVRRISSLIRESSGEIIELPEGVFYIGSDPLNCGYCLEMPDVRDRHVAFRTTLTDSHISEVGIDPGDAPSLINGETFTGLVRRLEHGDLITIGGENFIFRCL